MLIGTTGSRAALIDSKIYKDILQTSPKITVILEGSTDLFNLNIKSIINDFVNPKCLATFRHKDIYNNIHAFKEPLSILSITDNIQFLYQGFLVGDSSGCWRDAKTEFKQLKQSPIAVGYWGSMSPNQFIFNKIDTVFNVIILAFILSKSQEDYNMGTISIDDTYWDNKLVQQIKNKQNKGVFVLASIGGASSTKNMKGPSDLTPQQEDNWVNNMYANWVKIANKYNLDGIDIDLEKYTVNKKLYYRLLKKIADGKWIISIVPEIDSQTIGRFTTGNPCTIATSDWMAYSGTSIFENILENDIEKFSYNNFLKKDQFWNGIDEIDLINLQIYNNEIHNTNFETSLLNFLKVFAIWCNCGNYYTSDSTSICTNKCINLNHDISTNISTCNKSTDDNILHIPPSIIKTKFILGFCGNDCTNEDHYNTSEQLNMVHKVLPYFRGIMLWSLDEYANSDNLQPEIYVKKLLGQ